MRLSLSSSFVTIVFTSVLIIFFNILLTNKKSYTLFRTDFLSTLAIIIAIRLLFPVEFKFTHTIAAAPIMNPIHNIMFYRVHSFSIYQLLLLLWITGIIFNLAKYAISIFQVNRKFRLVISNAKKLYINNLFHGCNDYPVFTSSIVQVPTVFGTKKVIFLPIIPYTQNELSNILRHEISHIKHHDGFIKLVINFLVILYWWNPFIYIFRKQIYLLLEIQADYKSTYKFNKSENNQYIMDLISIQKKSYFYNQEDRYYTSNIIDENLKILEYRINYIIEGKYKKNTNKLFLSALLMLPLLTNSIILEPSFTAPNDNELISEKDLKKGYITVDKKGNYVFHMGKFEGEINDPYSKEFKDVPIIKEN